MSALPSGPYAVRIGLAGFKTYTREGVQLGSGQTVRQGFELELGTVEESVTVAGEAPLIETATSSQATSLGSQEVRELPVGSRAVLIGGRFVLRQFATAQTQICRRLIPFALTLRALRCRRVSLEEDELRMAQRIAASGIGGNAVRCARYLEAVPDATAGALRGCAAASCAEQVLRGLPQRQGENG